MKASNGLKTTSRNMHGAVLMITHDRYFLDNVVEWILELDRGSYFILTKATIRPISRRRPSAWSRKAARGIGQAKALSRELEWIPQTPSARQTKSKARIRKFEELQEAQGAASAGQGANRHSSATNALAAR